MSATLFITVYADMYGGYWGTGATPEAAKKVAKANGGKGITWATFALPEGATSAWASAMGGISWEWAEGLSDEAKDATVTLLSSGRGWKIAS